MHKERPGGLMPHPFIRAFPVGEGCIPLYVNLVSVMTDERAVSGGE